MRVLMTDRSVIRPTDGLNGAYGLIMDTYKAMAS